MANFGQVNKIKDIMQSTVGETLGRLDSLVEYIQDDINTDPAEAYESLQSFGKQVDNLIDSRILKAHLGGHIAIYSEDDIDSHPSVLAKAGSPDLQERQQNVLLKTQDKQKDIVAAFDSIKSESTQEWEHAATGQESLMNSVYVMKEIIQGQLEKGPEGINIGELKDSLSGIKEIFNESQERMTNIAKKETAQQKMNDFLDIKADNCQDQVVKNDVGIKPDSISGPN